MAAAALIPLAASMAGKGGDKGTSALKQDIAVVKWTTAPKKKGKGKKAKVIPPKEVELHVNGASLGIAAAAIGGAALIGAAALWAAGMGLQVQQGKEKIIKTRTEVRGDPANPTIRTYVYTGKNRPVRVLDGYPSDEGILSRTEVSEGWKMAKKAQTIVESTGSGETIYNAYVFRNSDKRSIKVGNRPRFQIFGSNSDNGTNWNDYLKYTSPIPAVWLVK